MAEETWEHIGDGVYEVSNAIVVRTVTTARLETEKSLLQKEITNINTIIDRIDADIAKIVELES